MEDNQFRKPSPHPRRPIFLCRRLQSLFVETGALRLVGRRPSGRWSRWLFSVGAPGLASNFSRDLGDGGISGQGPSGSVAVGRGAVRCPSRELPGQLLSSKIGQDLRCYPTRVCMQIAEWPKITTQHTPSRSSHLLLISAKSKSAFECSKISVSLQFTAQKIKRRGLQSAITDIQQYHTQQSGISDSIQTCHFWTIDRAVKNRARSPPPSRKNHSSWCRNREQGNSTRSSCPSCPSSIRPTRSIRCHPLRVGASGSIRKRAGRPRASRASSRAPGDGRRQLRRNKTTRTAQDRWDSATTISSRERATRYCMGGCRVLRPSRAAHSRPSSAG